VQTVSLLETIYTPRDLRRLAPDQLPALATGLTTPSLTAAIITHINRQAQEECSATAPRQDR
jgi:hypothetical protein